MAKKPTLKDLDQRIGLIDGDYVSNYTFERHTHGWIWFVVVVLCFLVAILLNVAEGRIRDADVVLIAREYDSYVEERIENKLNSRLSEQMEKEGFHLECIEEITKPMTDYVCIDKGEFFDNISIPGGSTVEFGDKVCAYRIENRTYCVKEAWVRDKYTTIQPDYPEPETEPKYKTYPRNPSCLSVNYSCGTNCSIFIDSFPIKEFRGCKMGCEVSTYSFIADIGVDNRDAEQVQYDCYDYCSSFIKQKYKLED